MPGNLDGGIDKLLNTAPANVPAVIADSLQDYRDDNNPQNPTTPPEVTIVRPWINAAEGRTPVMLRGSSENANEGGVVRITVLKNGVVLATLKTAVDADGHWQVPMPGTLASLGVLDGETLTIRAYIDPDHPASVDARYDATPPAAPQAPADMLASDDSANDSDDLTSQIRPGFQIGALPEEELLHLRGQVLARTRIRQVQAVLVDQHGLVLEPHLPGLLRGVLVEATYNAQTGVIQPAQSLADGGRRITYRYIDFAGNVGPEGAPLQIVVDSQAPQAPASAPDLQAVSDSGTSQSDNITSDQRPRFVVGAAPEPRLTVELVVDGEVVSATWDANTGTLRPTEAMSHGSHTVAYRWVDAAGNASEAGPALNVDVDTVAPTARFIQVALSNDTGSSATDLVTKSAAQNITAQLSGALFPGDQVWASSNGGSTWTDVSSMVNANGQLRWNGVTLSGGANSLQFKVIDAAGNAGAISTQAYTLDTTPSALTVSSVRISNDTGLSDSDFVTRAAAQTVSGELQLSGLATALASGDRLMGSSNGGATWQDITSSVNGTALTWNNVTLSNGANSLRFKVIDLAGNEGAVSTQNYTLDTVAPAAPESFSWATYPNGISSSSNSVSGNIGLVPFTYTLTSQTAAQKLFNASTIVLLADASGYTAPLNLNSSSNLANHSFFPTGYGVPNQTSIRNDLASINTLTFDSPMSNLVLAFSSIGNPSRPVSIEFPQPVEILWSTGYGNGPDVRVDVGTRSAATQITGWEGNMVVRFNGTVDQFVFNYLSNETYVNFAFGASVFDLLAPEQDTGIKSIDDITHVTRPAFKIQNKPSDAVSAELLINGQLVAATYNAADASLGANNAADDTLTPNLPLSDGVYQVSYRFIDLAGTASAGGSVTTVTIDTRAPVNTSLNTFTPDAIGGNYEPGTTLSLKVNGVSINANRLLLNATNGTWSFVPTQSELTQAGTGLLNKATSTFDLTATDLAGNETVASKTVTKDVFNAPYVKEFIPTDGGILANDSTGHATLNLVFSKAVQAGTGKIKLFDVSNDALVAEIDVTSNALRIEGNDLYVTLPALSTGTRYYVTLDAGTFVDSAGQAYLGKTETGTAGWDFTGALASIAPDFVAQDDIVNANESAAVVRITGKVVSSVAVLEDIVAGDLSVNVAVPQGAAAVTATLQSYNNQTGEFVFTVPAQAWANGNYGYTVSLHGSTGDAASVTASYNFANLAVDLVAPTGIIGSIDRIMDDTGQSQGNLFPSSLKMLDSGFGSTTGTTKVTDVNVTDLDLTVLTATMAGAYVPGAVTAVYNSGSTVYNSDRSSVSFWVQYTDSQYTKALQLRLTDAASGIELKVLQARYQSGALATTHNWNQSPGNFMTVAGSLTGGGYGLSALEFGSGSSAALQSNGLTDDNTPTLGGGLTRALAQGERVAIDRTDGQGNVVTITGKDGLIVDGTTWTFNDGTLADGRYTYRLYVEDAAGNRTASSTARTITVDTAAPTAVVTAATLSQDTGVSNTDRLTKVAAQTVTGTLNAALGAGEKLMASLDGGTTFIDITSTVSNTSFNWTNATLRDGSGRLTFKVVDAMGNVGTVFEQSYTLDTAPPATPTVAAVRVDVDSDKILTGTAQLAAGDSLSVSVNGAVYQVTPDNQGAWQLNLATTTASSGVLGAWTAGQKYEVAVTITDAAGNTAVDTSTQEITIPANGPVPLRTIDVSGLVTSYGAYQPIKPHDQFGNVLIKETDGHFTVPLGVTILDSSSTFTGTVGTWGTFSTELAPLKENPVLYQDYYWGKLANTVSSPKIPASAQSGYVLRDFSADSNTPASIAQFLNANSITAKSDSVDKFYLILNVDDIDGTGQSGAVVAYVNGTRTAIAGIDAGSITVVDSYIGHTASEFTADNFMSGNSPLATTWIDDAANSTVIGTSANDRLYAGTGADVIKGNGGFDEITLATDAHSDIIYFQNLPGFTAVKNFQITATGSVRDQFDFSEFGFYREDLQVLPSQNSYGGSSGYNSFPRGVNASGKILAASYMYQSGFTAAGIIDNDLFKIVDTAHEVKNLFSSGFLVLDDNSESIVITTQNGLGAYIFHVEDIDTSAGMNMSVTPLGYFWGTEPYIHILTAENITARPPQPDYISIGRLDAGKTAFGA